MHKVGSVVGEISESMAGCFIKHKHDRNYKLFSL